MSVAIAGDSNQVQTLLLNVTFDEQRVSKEQLVLLHAWLLHKHQNKVKQLAVVTFTHHVTTATTRLTTFVCRLV